MRLRAMAETPRPKLARARSLSRTPPAAARRPARKIYWADLKRELTTPIFDGALLRPGNTIPGPAVVETSETTVVVHPGRSVAVDAYGNFELHFGLKAAPRAGTKAPDKAMTKRTGNSARTATKAATPGRRTSRATQAARPARTAAATGRSSAKKAR